MWIQIDARGRGRAGRIERGHEYFDKFGADVGFKSRDVARVRADHGHLAIRPDGKLHVDVHQIGGVADAKRRVRIDEGHVMIVHIPGDHGVVGVARVIVLRVDLDAVPVGIANVEVERVRDAVPAGSALDAVAHAQGAQLVADRDDVVLLVGGERDVVHARPVAAGHGGVVHGGLAAHPRGVDDAVAVLDILGDPETEIHHVRSGPRNVGSHLVEVVEANKGAGVVELA